jgi:hypothetical protein
MNKIARRGAALCCFLVETWYSLCFKVQMWMA